MRSVFSIARLCVALLSWTAGTWADTLEVTPGVDLAACIREFSATRANRPQLEADADTFFTEYFLPVVGQRGAHRPFLAEDGALQWEGYPGKKTYRLEFSKDISEPTLDDTPEVRTLRVPVKDRFKNLTAGDVKKWLLGHPLHPFIVDPKAKAERQALNPREPDLLHRQVQLDAAKVGKTYLDKFEETADPQFQRFLYVAPTGTGKSEIYLELLSKRLDQVGKGPGLLIVASERANVVKDRYNEALALQKKSQDFEIIHWGGTREANAGVTDLAALMSRVQNAKKPVVLVTTFDSLHSALGPADASSERMSSLKDAVRGLFIDEAHHLGGNQISDTVSQLLDGNKKATLTGFTATPISRNQSIQKLFNHHGFWAYLDDAAAYQKEPKPLNRETADIAKQLRIAFQEGELVGFDAIRYLPMKEEADEAELFIKRDPANPNSISVINPTYHPKLLAKLKPILTTGKGILVANDVTEARALTQAINQLFGKANSIRAELITHDSAPAGSKTEEAILKRFKEGQTQILVSVMKLDEGINIHDANFYIDLDPNPPARQFLQRVGRTTRVSPGKTETHVYLLSEFTEEELRKKLTEAFGGKAGQKKNKKKDKEEEQTVDVDVEQFLKELENQNVEKVNFWADHRYSLPETEFEAFQKEIILQAAELFPGQTKKTRDFFEGLAQKLPKGEQEIYVSAPTPPSSN